MKHHPFTEIWPPVQGEAFEKIKADIAAKGQRLPIILYKGAVIDGRTRERACEELGIAPRYEDSGAASDAEALSLVVSLNEHRRHLNKDQRAFAADKLANIIHGHNRFEEKIIELSKDNSTISVEAGVNHQPISLVAAARAMDVTTIGVSRARGIRRNGGQSAIDEVLSGKVSLSTQYNKVTSKRGQKIKEAATRGPGRPPKRPPSRPSLADAPIVRSPHQALTPQEVDPEFTGTPHEFARKYGHAQGMTAEQYANERFATWAYNLLQMRNVANNYRDWPPVDHNWLRNPRSRDIAKMAEALDYLRPKIAEAEALLERAKEAEEAKRPAPDQQDAVSLRSA